jgi:hypothetical protein
LEKNLLHIDKFKGQAAVSIPLLGPTKRFVQDWQQGRFRKKTIRRAGSRGLATFDVALKWRSGFLFPSKRGAKIKHASKDVVSKARPGLLGCLMPGALISFLQYSEILKFWFSQPPNPEF